MGKVLKMINLRRIFNTSCRGTIDNSHVNLPRLRSGVQLSLLEMFFFLFLVLLLFLLFFSHKTYFHILTDLKYTGRLIAGFISTS